MHCIPNLVDIHYIILMDDQVSHTGHLLPGDLRIFPTGLI